MDDSILNMFISKFVTYILVYFNCFMCIFQFIWNKYIYLAVFAFGSCRCFRFKLQTITHTCCVLPPLTYRATHRCILLHSVWRYSTLYRQLTMLFFGSASEVNCYIQEGKWIGCYARNKIHILRAKWGQFKGWGHFSWSSQRQRAVWGLVFELGVRKGIYLKC